MVFRIIKSNWWVPLIIVPVFYGIGKLYVYRLITTYKASTEFLLRPDDAFYRSNVVNEQNFFANSYIDNSNETRILKSYDLTRKTVDKLLPDIQVSYFIVGKVRTTEYFRGMPFRVMVNAINPNFYELKFDFTIIDENTYELSYELGGERTRKEGNFGKDLIDLNYQFNIRWTEQLSQSTAATFKNIFYQFAVHSRDQLISQIRSNLSIENPQFTQILKVDLKDVIPDRAVLVLDTLNKVYAENKLRSKYELNERTIEYIDRQLNEITFSLRSIEDTMQAYKEKRSIINLDWQEEDFLKKISSYDAQKSQRQLELNALNDLEKYIIEDRDPQFLPPSVFIFERSGFMSTAVEELYSKQIELNKKYGSTRSPNPVIVELEDNIKKTKQDLLVYISNSRRATQQQIQNLNEEISDYVTEAKAIPGKQRDILNIQRKASVSEQLYNFLLEKKASTKIARASIVPDVKIVEAPRVTGSDADEKLKTEKQALSAGLFLTLAIIIIRSLFYAKIKTVEHLKELTSLPLVGVLPWQQFPEKNTLVLEQAPNSGMADAFRNLRTNLQYASIDNKAQTFLITSFLPNEGKTFTSSNLAALLARSGKKVLLIELDLHKPKVFKTFKVTQPTTGLTTLIAGLQTLQEVISPTSIENLYCIYAGPIPPNPSDLVLSEKLRQCLEEVKQQFDFVFIDTPPAGLLSDALYLMQYADASIFVLNTKTSTRRTINFLEQIIETNGLKNVNLILNGVSISRRKYYYAGYGYSYGYGYGYGYGKGRGIS